MPDEPPPTPEPPLGTERSIIVAILLTVVTLGIYCAVWVYRTHEEIRRYSGLGVGGVVGFVIFLVMTPVTFFVIPSEIRQLYEAQGARSPVRGVTGLWFLLPGIGLLVWFVRVQGALNSFWSAKSARTA